MTKKTILLGFFIFLKLALQYFAIDAGYELHRDEYLHLDLGKHLAWGYSSVPPVTAWISWLILYLGNSVFLIKFFPALFGVLTLVVVWKTIEELNGNLFALVLGSVCVLSSILLRINTLYQPNSLEYLLWTVLFFTLIKYINSENNKWLWLASLTFALGFLNKYNITFLLLGLLPALLISKHRKIFLNKHLYFSLLVALLLVSPNLIWQYNNDFPVFHHLKTLAQTQLVNVNRVDFLKEQLLFFIGGLFVLILAFISFFRYAPFRKYQIFFWSYIFTIAIFTYFKAKGYYAIGLYPILLAFGAVYLEKLLKEGWLRYVQPIAVLIPIVIILPLFQIIVPVLSPHKIIEKTELFKRIGMLRWEDGQDHALPQDYADMLGWSELANLVDIAFNRINDKEHTLIHCDNYGQAGAINFYSIQNYTQAVSMNADYINWYPLDKMEIKNVILVKENTDMDSNMEEEMILFDKITLVGEIKNKYARESGAKVYLLEGAKQSINKILLQEITERKTIADQKQNEKLE
ncbi:MAG: glycosyltransferase family 39 protein [Bacteroidetes bacterium]|nr:glycosyltransferase family 39 protein [Bacteroidota bacterium]